MKNKPNIVQIAAYYPPHLGGLEMVAQEVSLELAKRHYPVTVLTSDIGVKHTPPTPVDSTIAPYYHVHRLLSWDIAHTPIMWSFPFRLLFLPKKSILHVHVSQAGLGEIALLVAKMRNFPYVAHFHLDVGPSGSLGWILPYYKKFFLGPVLRGASKVIVFSEPQVELLNQKYGVKKENIAIIPNGVGEKFFNPSVRTTPHDPLRLLYVGRLDIQKRVERLIEAIALLKIPAHLMLVGDGEQRPILEALVQKLGLTNVSFEGRKSSAELIEYYRNADVYLTSSDREGMSLVALEAMAGGLPMMGTNVIGTHELMQDVGVLIDEPYVENFADAITALWLDPAQFAKLSAQSAEKAKRYSWDKLIDKLETIYQEIQ